MTKGRSGDAGRERERDERKQKKVMKGGRAEKSPPVFGGAGRRSKRRLEGSVEQGTDRGRKWEEEEESPGGRGHRLAG